MQISLVIISGGIIDIMQTAANTFGNGLKKLHSMRRNCLLVGLFQL